MSTRVAVVVLMVTAGVALTAFAPGHAQAQETIYFAPNVARTVTLSKQGVLLASMAVPAGTAISVRWEGSPSTRPTAEGRFEVHGNVEVRLMAGSQRDRSIPLQEAMSQSPLTVTGDAVDLVVSP
jgi:hypothetical protein